MAEFDRLPPATPKNKGKKFFDSQDNVLLESDGVNWVPLQPPQIGAELPQQAPLTGPPPSLGDPSQLVQQQGGVTFPGQRGGMAAAGAPMEPGGFIKEGVAPAVLPSLGALAGAPFGPGGIAAGSLGGEIINQATGITQPSITQLVLSGGLPLTGKTASVIGRVIKTFAPPAKSAALLNIFGHDAATRFFATFRPQEKVDDLFRLATEVGDDVPVGKTVEALEELIGQLSRRSTPPRALRRLQKLKNKLDDAGGVLSPEDMNAEMAAFGELQGNLEATRGEAFGAVKRVNAALNQDLDKAAEAIVRAGGDVRAGGAVTLRFARDTSRKVRVLDRIEEVLDAAFQTKAGTGEVRQFNPQLVMRKIRADKFFEKAFTAAEQAEIEKLLNLVNRIPALPPGAGTPFGSGRFIRGAFGGRIVGGALGGAMAGVGLGVDPVMAGAIGSILPASARIGRDFAIALSIPEGRAFLTAILRDSKGILGSRTISLIGAFVATRYQEEGAEELSLPGGAESTPGIEGP